MARPRTGWIAPRADGRYTVRTSYLDSEGKTRQIKRIADTKSEANLLLSAILREAEEAETGARQDNPQACETFDQLVRWYKRHHAVDPVYAEGHKVAGLRGKRTVLYRVRLLSEYFGNIRLALLTHSQIKAYKLARLKQKTPRGTPLKLQSVHRELATLRHMLHIAVREGWLDRNPFQQGEALIVKAHEQGRTRTVTPDEETRLLIHCADARAHLRPIVICAIDTGMRAGEIFKLRWPDVDLPKRLITVQAMNTKTLTRRQIPISARLAVELKRLWEFRRAQDERVFGIKQSISKAWKTLCDKAEVRDLQFRDLRHTFASRMAAAGLNPFAIALLMGHTTPTMTLHYTHLTPDLSAQAVKALDAGDQSRLHSAQNTRSHSRS